MDATLFASLPEDIQVAMEEAATYAGQQVSEDVLEREEAKKEELTGKGVTFIEVDNAAFSEHFTGYVETNFPDLADWVGKIKEIDT